MWERLACMKCGAKVQRKMTRCPKCGKLPLPRLDGRFEQIECLSSHNGCLSLRVQDHHEHCEAFMRVVMPGASPSAKKMLVNEADLLEILAGSYGFPRYIWAAEDDDGSTYLVRSFVKGFHPKTALAWKSPEAIIEAHFELFHAIALLHAKDCVHTALMPDIFLLSDTGTSTIMDLRPVQPAGGRALGTGRGRYRAPEQVANLGPITPATDVFALGVMLYRSLTGVFPYPRNPKKLIKPGLRPVLPSEHNDKISPALDNVILQALEQQPDKRFVNAGEFLVTLMAAFGDATDPDAGGPRFSLTFIALVSSMAPSALQALQTYLRALGSVTGFLLGRMALWHMIALAVLGLGSVLGWAVFGRSSIQADVALPIPAWREEAVEVQFLSWPPARVYVDGKFLVEAPSTFPYLLVGPKHTVDFVSRNGRRATFILNGELGTSYRVKCNLDSGHVSKEELVP